MKDDRKLNIVNDNDEIIGIKTRGEIHKNGLLHREIHVWFYTPNGEIIFQHRATDKDTFPDLLDATAGGHVEIGESYEEAAIKETKEETGITLKIGDLQNLGKIKNRSEDVITGAINNAFKQEFAYLFLGDISQLKVETGKAIGFEKFPIEDIMNADQELRKRILPTVLSPEVFPIFEKIKGFLEYEH